MLCGGALPHSTSWSAWAAVGALHLVARGGSPWPSACRIAHVTFIQLGTSPSAARSSSRALTHGLVKQEGGEEGAGTGTDCSAQRGASHGCNEQWRSSSVQTSSTSVRPFPTGPHPGRASACVCRQARTLVRVTASSPNSAAGDRKHNKPLPGPSKGGGAPSTSQQCGGWGCREPSPS